MSGSFGVVGKEVGFEIHVLLQYLIKIVTQQSSSTESFSYYYFLKVTENTPRKRGSSFFSFW